VGVLDVGGYWDPILEMGDRMVAEGFLPGHLRAALLLARDPEALIDGFLKYEPTASRWAPSGVKP
jgi:predicted Rossmann-fold nucleotide-binding protein